MTLVIAAPGKDFILIGADSRGTVEFGAARVETNSMSKMIPLTKYTAVLLYGSADFATHLIEKFKSEEVNDLKWVKEISGAFSVFCQEEERKLADVPRHEDDFGFIIAGLDEEDEGHKAYAYDLCSYYGFRLGLCRPYAIQGKPIIARYKFEKEYAENLSVDELSRLVAQSIYDTQRIDGDVGGRIRMAIIDSDGLREFLTPDIANLIDSWDIKGLEIIR